MSNLNDTQRRALDQLRELTNGGSDEISISVLQSVDWNVEVSNYPASSSFANQATSSEQQS